MSEGSTLIVGHGTIGSALATRLRDAGRSVLVARRRPEAEGELMLDLSSPPATWPSLPAVDWVVVCAGVTSLRACEDDPVGTARSNVEGPLALAEAIASRGGRLTILSSNLVFDGEATRPSPEQKPTPTCEYGRQKAELEARLTGPLASAVNVLRLTKVIDPTIEPFAGWCQSLRAGRPVSAFTDLRLAPLPINEVTKALERIGEGAPTGILHLSGGEELGYDAFARAIAEELGADPALIRSTTSDAAGVSVVARPRHAALDDAASRHQLGLPPAESVTAVAHQLVRSRP